MPQKTQPIFVVAAVIRQISDSAGRVLIVRRGPSQSGAGAWEFPGGKVERGESPSLALIREIKEELGIDIHVKEQVGERDFAYPTKTIRLRVYWATPVSEDLTLTEHDAYQWVRPEQIDIESLSEADRPFISDLIQGSK